MKALFIRADNQEDLTSYKYIDSVNLTIPQYEKEARQLLVNQAKDRNRSVAMAKQRAAEKVTAAANSNGDDAEEDYNSLTDDQLAFRIQKCLLPMGGTMFYEGRGTVNMVANYLAHREIRGNAVIIPAGYESHPLVLLHALRAYLMVYAYPFSHHVQVPGQAPVQPLPGRVLGGVRGHDRNAHFVRCVHRVWQGQVDRAQQVPPHPLIHTPPTRKGSLQAW